MVAGGRHPNRKFHAHLGIRGYYSNATLNISNPTWYTSTAIGWKIYRPGPAGLLSTISYGGTLQSCVGGGGSPPRKKFHLRLGSRRCTSNTTSRISNTSWSIWKAVTDQLRRPGQGERIPALSYGGTLQKRAGGWCGLPRNERLFEAGYGGTLQTHGRAEWCAFFRNVLETHQSRKPDLPHFNHDLVHVASH